MANHSDAALELALDTKAYNEEDLISIKQPINLPYYSNSPTYQRIDGEVEMNGIKYKYVKCRIYNDSLEMRCIPNKAKMKIEQYKSDYANFAHDFQQDTNKKKSGNENKSFQKSLSEFEELTQAVTNNSAIIILNTFISFNSLVENKHYFNTVEQPPDAG